MSTLEEGTRAKVLFIQDEHVERDERDVLPARRAEVWTEPIEAARSSGFGDELAIKHEPPAELGQRLKILEAISDVPAGARSYRHGFIDVDERAPAVELRLERPLCAILRRLDAREHGSE